MAQTYTRQSTMSDGDTITAALFNNEYNQLVNAFSYSSSNASATGHRHDGSSGQGGNIHTIGDLDFLNKIVVDSTNNRWGFFVEVSSSAVEQIRIQDGAIVPVTDNDIDLGTSSLEFKDGYFDGTLYADAINFNGTAISATAAELNILDGVTSTAAELNILDGVTSTTAELNILDGVTSTTAELNILDGVTSTTAELNILDGVTSTTAELNILDGVTATAAEINILDGVTSTTAELNILDGVTATTAELNYSDTGSSVGTVVASKVVTVDSNKDVSSFRNITLTGELDAGSLDISGDADIDGTLETDALSINGTSVTATAAELNILDGVTSTAAELNILDGVTSTTAELNILDGVTATTAELNILDGVTATTAELNILDGVTVTAAEINTLDGITAVLSELNALDLGSTAVGTAIASKAVILDSNKDYTGIRNFTITGELDAATLDISGDVDIDGTTNLDVVDIDGAVDMASTLTVGGLTTLSGNVTANNLSVTSGNWLGFGDYGERIAGNNSTSKLFFYTDATLALTLEDTQDATFAGHVSLADSKELRLGGGDDLKLYHNGSNSYIKDVGTGNLYIAGSGNITFTNGDVDETYAIFNDDGAVVLKHDDSTKLSTSSSGISVTGTVTATNLDISGDIDVDGTTNLDAVDIDGAVQIDSTVTVGADDTGYDVKFFGATSGSYMLWDESTDDLILGGASRLGIGTTSPSSYFHIEAADSPTVRLVDTTNNATLLAYAQNTEGVVGTYSNHNLLLASNSTTALTIDTSQNVGIGVTNPSDYYAKDLVVTGPSEGGITIAATGDHTNYLLFADSTSGVARYAGMVGYSHPNDMMSFRTNSLERVIIDSNGEVGIGTTNPASTLDLGSGTANKGIAWGGTSSDAHYTTIWSEYGTASLILGAGLKPADGAAGFRSPYTGTYGYAGIELDSWSDDGIKFYVGADASRTKDASITPTEAMRITTAGNVGIGVTSTGHALEVRQDGVDVVPFMITNRNGADDDTTTLGFKNDDAGNGYIPVYLGTRATDASERENYFFIAVADTDNANVDTDMRLIIDSTGYVGIGETSPDTPVHVKIQGEPPAAGMMILEANASSNPGSRQLRIMPPTDSSNGYIDYRGGNLLFKDDGSEVARFQGSTSFNLNGKLLLYTTDDQANYYAVYTHTDDSLRINYNNSGNDEVILDNSGNFLVGTTNTNPAGADTAGVALTGASGISVQGTTTALTIGVPSAQDYGMAFRYQGDLAGRIGIDANNITLADVSDYRLKENIAPLTDTLKKIKALKPSTFNFISHPDKTHEGFVAHELQKVIPYAVTGEKDALITEATKDRGTVGDIDPQAVDLRKLVPTLVAAIQEQQSLIESLTERIELLED